MQNLDALIEITPSNYGTYKAKVNYLENGTSTNYYPLIISNINVIKNKNYPIILIFGNTTNKNTGFLIQFDTKKSSAQFNPYSSTSGTSGEITCSYKI